jgi:glutathione S-transferase
MILIGQYDSPFVRRVAVALQLYAIPYEHRPWSTFGDAERIAAYNPLRRVPTLVLDDGEVLIDSVSILDYLDEAAGPARALLPPSGSDRRQALRICALATGLADKAVSLVYERVLHAQVSPAWVDRCSAQIRGVLDLLNAERAVRGSVFWFGDAIGHADIATWRVGRAWPVMRRDVRRCSRSRRWCRRSSRRPDRPRSRRGRLFRGGTDTGCGDAISGLLPTSRDQRPVTIGP